MLKKMIKRILEDFVYCTCALIGLVIIRKVKRQWKREDKRIRREMEALGL